MGKIRVVDCSVAIHWFTDRPERVCALQLLSEVQESPHHFAVPELFYFELTHVFNRLFPRPTAEQLYLFSETLNLGLHREAMTEELSNGIREFQGLGLSGYDAAYVALARMLRGHWLTFDKAAHARVARYGLSKILE